MDKQTYFHGTGRRKEAVARVKLLPGDGAIIINGTPYEERYSRLEHRRAIMQPLLVTERTGKFNVVAKVNGGGVSGQSGAICHGIARALVNVPARHLNIRSGKSLGEARQNLNLYESCFGWESLVQ